MKNLSKKQWFIFGGIIFLQFLTMTYSQFGSIILVLEALFYLLLIHLFLKEPIKDYGLTFTRIPVQIFSGIILATVMLYLTYGNNTYLTISQMAERFFRTLPSGLSFLYILNLFLHAIPEEIFYRGILLNFFQKIFRYPFISIFIGSLLFGLSHYPTSHYWSKVISSFFFGFVFSYLRIKEPEEFPLFSLTVAHFLYNLGLAFIIGPY